MEISIFNVVSYLVDEETIAAYLNEAIVAEDLQLLLQALGDVELARLNNSVS